MFKKKPIDRNFVSTIDKALANFNSIHLLSPAQQAEYDKYQRVYQLRDHATALPKVKDIWDFTKD